MIDDGKAGFIGFLLLVFAKMLVFGVGFIMEVDVLFLRSVRTKFFLDLLVWSCVPLLAFALRLDALIPNYATVMFAYTLFFIIPKAILISIFRLHRQAWHKAGVHDLYRLVMVVGAWTAVVGLLNFVLHPNTGVPRGVPLIEGCLAVLCLGGVRLLARVYFERDSRKLSLQGSAKRVLIVGAGEAGTMIAREMLRHPMAGLVPVGFLDDEIAKLGQSFVGLPVLGNLASLPYSVARSQATEVLIAMPSVAGRVVRQVVTLAREVGVPHRIIPGVFEILSGQVSMNHIRPIVLEDLLRREPITLEINEIGSYLRGRTVLVTGAGGSIGSELVRQIVRFDPECLVLVGRGENSVFVIQQELRRSFPKLLVHAVIVDVRDLATLRRAFDRFRPEVVFHAAAHKHVPLMEENPWEAVVNNVQGTANVAELSLEFGVKRLVNISTDKAVNPTSVMGASKRVAELVVQKAAARASERQRFVSVRFGNVLGSRGSVIPVFQEQIRVGGPITVTHPEMTRYFMTIPEASQLVLQAAGFAGNGAVYILDMGEPVKIVDLAQDLIELSGYEVGVDIDIVFSGTRPGEKLYEELLTSEEGVGSSKHSKIFVAPASDFPQNFDDCLNDLCLAAIAGDATAIRRCFVRLVPSFQSPARQHSPTQH